MVLTNVKLTKQMEKAFMLAELECLKENNQCIWPLHLLIGCLDEGSFPVKEAIEKSGINIDLIRDSIVNADGEYSLAICKPFNIPLSQGTKEVIDQAIKYMANYNQIFLNEGHVLKAIITTGQADGHLSEEQKQAIMTISVVSRDMLLNLTDYDSPEISYKNIRKATKKDEDALKRFIDEEFSGRWNESIKKGLSEDEAPIFVALDSTGNIVGFAAYHVTKGNAYFGPMGVSIRRRSEGIGESLLHQTLDEMKLKGYKEIIIGGAGPIEFYERSCAAKVIPVN
jgi:N-acetylglutamate synthase-like GNAT family acetyltransferase